MRSTTVRWLAPMLLVCPLVTSLEGGEKETTTKGQVQVKVGSHALKMEAGKLYRIEVKAEKFQPIVNIRPGFLRTSFQPNRRNFVEAYFMPMQSTTFQLTVLPDIFGAEQTGEALDYTLKFRNIGLDAKPVLKEVAKLTEGDDDYKPRDPNFKFVKDRFHKTYDVKLKAGQFYIIEMIRGNDANMDPYLFLEDSAGKIVGSDDDGAGNLNSRLVYQPTKDGDYRIIATTLARATGGFTLTVQTEAKE